MKLQRLKHYHRCRVVLACVFAVHSFDCPCWDKVFVLAQLAHPCKQCNNKRGFLLQAFSKKKITQRKEWLSTQLQDRKLRREAGLPEVQGFHILLNKKINSPTVNVVLFVYFAYSMTTAQFS